MPNAPPTSKLVSEIADAAPARSGGAAPITRSVVIAPIGDSPMQKAIMPANRSHGV